MVRVVAHRGTRIGVAGGDLHVPEINTGIEHGGDKRVAEHMRMNSRPQAGGLAGRNPAVARLQRMSAMPTQLQP